jgi:hypothetical protein
VKDLTVVLGQAGIGKSRLILWLALCQILEIDWCGIAIASSGVKREITNHEKENEAEIDES